MTFVWRQNAERERSLSLLLSPIGGQALTTALGMSAQHLSAMLMLAASADEAAR